MLVGSKQPPIVGKGEATRSLQEGLKFSVIMRTQGTRLSLLREALASLFVQTEKRFEVLLCVHNRPELESAVQVLVDEFPEGFANKVRLLSVEGGGRCRPLNAGLEAAEGVFVCFLDDDDLLLDNHFASVAAYIERSPNQRAYHTYGALRTVKVLSQDSYTTAGVQLSYTLPFCIPFQLVENSVPICNIFVSTELIDSFQIRFDESYEVLEDWQFLMEVNRYSTVCTVPVVTTVINVRTDQTNTTNDPALGVLWKETRQRYQRYLAETPRILTESEMAQAVRLSKYLWEYTHKAIYSKALALEPLVNLIEKRVPKKVVRSLRRKLSGGKPETS